MKIFVHISINDLVAHTLNILLAYELPHYAQYVRLEVTGFLLSSEYLVFCKSALTGVGSYKWGYIEYSYFSGLWKFLARLVRPGPYFIQDKLKVLGQVQMYKI